MKWILSEYQEVFVQCIYIHHMSLYVLQETKWNQINIYISEALPYNGLGSGDFPNPFYNFYCTTHQHIHNKNGEEQLMNKLQCIVTYVITLL